MAGPPMNDLPALDPHAQWALADGQVDNPFAILGPHRDEAGRFIRVYVPGADAVSAVFDDGEAVALSAAEPAGLFAGRVANEGRYVLQIAWQAATQTTEDPFAFGPVLTDVDLYLVNEGRHFELGRAFGAHLAEMDGVSGVRFAVWAPNARTVSVVGDFNSWDSRRHPMRRRGDSGVWDFFLPGLTAGAAYKYQIIAGDGRRLPLKSDPVANATEMPPRTASVVPRRRTGAWNDEAWMKARGERHGAAAPLSVYEVHVGSWIRPSDRNGCVDWITLAERLIPYVKGLHFTHVELLPIGEHPFGGSWGYQPLGLFAPSRRFGEPEDFKVFVDACHRADIGVIVDWVPAHFPSDEHGMARFDGTALYEHEDPREGFHQDWKTLIYNLGRREVTGFLIASALHWLEHFHVDGLRVDAVASMLYRDYSRNAGEWIPNRFGGRENLESVDFVRHLNVVVADRCPGAMVIAEESTAWPGVTWPVDEGGLGFSYKWNMGWMHDTLNYMARDPIYRSHHHNEMTFGLIYAFSERFFLPLSHDEVVHGKGSLVNKMPGDQWQKFANLRSYFGFMWAHPGKKLLFMGGEIAQWREWNADGEIDWDLLGYETHQGVQRLISDLNLLYCSMPALHRRDAEPEGFEWLVGGDSVNSIFVFLRSSGDGQVVLAAVNMTPFARPGYRVGTPHAGRWREILNSDSARYGGSDVGNFGAVHSQPTPTHGKPHSIEIVLPPLATVLFTYENGSGHQS